MGSLSFGKTIIDEPKVKINLVKQLQQNSENTRQEPSASNKHQPIILPIKKIDLVINDGNLQVTNRESDTVELSQINSNNNPS